MKRFFFVIFFFLFSVSSSLFVFARENAQPTTLVGLENELYFPACKLEKRSFYGEQPIRLRVWKDSSNTGSYVAYWGLKAGNYDLNTWLTSHDSSLFSCAICIKGTLESKEDGRIIPVNSLWENIWRLPGYRFWYALCLLLWIGSFLYVLYARIKKYYLTHKKILINDNEDVITLYDQVFRIINDYQIRHEMHPSDAGTFYVLVLSAWAKKYNWGEKQRLTNLYPKIYAHPEINRIHAALQEWLFAKGEEIDFEALLKSCKIEETEQKNDI